MKRSLLILALFFGAFYFINSEEKKNNDAAAEYVDINRSMGTWYEIARITHWFERDLIGVTATYKMLPNGKIEMLNAGYRNTFNGRYKTQKGTAVVADEKHANKLNVCFFWPFWRQFWVYEVGPDYEYAVIGHPNKRYLWILSREPFLDDSIYLSLVEQMRRKGFNVEELEMTPQRTIDPEIPVMLENEIVPPDSEKIIDEETAS